MKDYIDFNQNPAILNEFLLYLKNTKNFSIGTIQGYEEDLIMFLYFELKYKEINIPIHSITMFILLQINQDDILAFLVYLNYHRNNCANTRKRKLAAIKAFYKWLYIKSPGIKKENPSINLPLIESYYRMPKFLTLEQAKQIQNIFNEKNCKNYIRNNAIITLFLSTGIRLSELLNLNIKDVNFNNNSILIKAKGDKERNIYFSNYCKLKLLNYLKTRNDNRKELFISSKKRRISKSSIENICKQAYHLMNLEDKKYTVHTLRHTAATIVFEYNNRDLLLLKEFLGHSSILSTEIYTHTYNNLAKEAVEKNPLNDFIKTA